MLKFTNTDFAQPNEYLSHLGPWCPRWDVKNDSPIQDNGQTSMDFNKNLCRKLFSYDIGGDATNTYVSRISCLLAVGTDTIA